MKKWKATVLLTIVLVITAILTVMSFAHFPVGTKDFNGFLGAIETEYDLSGGTAYTLTLDKDNLKDVENVDEVIDTLKYRLNLLGYENYSVKALKDVDDAVKDYDIRIELRGKLSDSNKVDKTALDSDIAVAAAFGELKFFGGTEKSPTDEILQDGKVVSNSSYVGAYSDSDGSTKYQVGIEFSDYGYTELSKLLKDNSTYYLEIKLGETVLFSGANPIAANYFNNKTLYITSQTETSARQFALQIKSGGLAYKYNVGDGVDVSSPLGANVAVKSVIAIAILVVAVIVAMFILDKKYGLIPCLSMILFIDLYLFLLIAIPGIRVAFGGVIGFALAVLLAADGFIITSKRIKEEFARGKTVKSALKAGFTRALAPVLGESAISIAGALILFALTHGAVKNFALLFAVGAAVSAITTLLFARMFTSLILPLADYKESFFGLKRTEDAPVSESEGE